MDTEPYPVVAGLLIRKAVVVEFSRVYFNCTTYIHVYIIWYEIHRN